MLNPPVLVERDHNSLYIAWEPHIEAVEYELQINTTHDVHNESQWTTLSATLQSNFAKKKNLVEGTPYHFRVRFATKDKVWCSWSHPSDALYVVPATTNIMESPQFFAHDGQSITIQWKEVPNASGYHIRYRDDNHLASWQPINDTIKSTVVKKKGLESHVGYHFSVMPVFDNDSDQRWAYSISAGPFKTATFSPQLASLLPVSILSKNGKTSAQSQLVRSADVLAGKHIAIYFSAHWCGPCRNFTPRLAELYQSIKTHNKNIEVIFCSADHDENGFQEYYASMPWLSVEFDDPRREQLMAQFKVSGIPRLTVLSASGKVIEENAASRLLTLNDVDNWLKVQ